MDITGPYSLAPRSQAGQPTPDFDLAGKGNEFEDLDEAVRAAVHMDETNPLPDGDEWAVFWLDPYTKRWVY